MTTRKPTRIEEIIQTINERYPDSNTSSALDRSEKKELKKDSTLPLQSPSTDSALQDRAIEKLLQPSDITCFDGIWMAGAIRLFSRKQHGTAYQHKLAVDNAKEIILFFQQNPQIEIFTIDSKDGKKLPLDRDYLRSSKCALHFSIGVIPGKDGAAAYAFVNKAQFEAYLENKRIVLSEMEELVSPESVISGQKEGNRKNELHECIGIVVRDLKQANNGHNPSGADAWREIKKRKEDFDCIQSIETDQKTKEEAIYWTSAKGIEQKMLKPRFLNVVSEFNTGKKRLAE